MQQLSGLDASFLFLETPEMPMHVGALQVFDWAGSGRRRFATALRAHVAARLSAAPVLRRRVWQMPLNLASPAWVDVEPDLREHIVEVVLPRGAGLADLETKVAQLHAQRLDRTRPLWKMHVFDGLAPGPDGLRRVALYTQLHHATVDGQAAVALANLLLDLSPTPRAPAPRGTRRAEPFAPGMTEMLRGALAQQASKIAQIVRELPATAGTLKNAALVAAARSPRFGGTGSGTNLGLAPRTPLNGTVGRTRAFATARVPLGPLKVIGRAHGATVNDMVLLLCSGALRRLLLTRKALPRKSLVAAVPVSLRGADDTEAGNRASLTLVSLGTHLADPWRRLAHIVAASADMKSTLVSVKRVLPTDFPSLGVPWLMEAAAALYGKARVADRLPLLANVVISNVPGPPVTLYLAGARLLASHPTSIVVHGLALNITVQGYDGALDFGLMADGEAMPDVRGLADAVRAAFDELVALHGADETEAAQAPSLATLARRGLGQAVGAATGAATRTARGVVGGVVGGVIGGAADSAWRGVVRQVSGNAAGRRKKGGR